MTDKEIAWWLRASRWWANRPVDHPKTYVSYANSRQSVRIIHHIINSINWED